MAEVAKNMMRQPNSNASAMQPPTTGAAAMAKDRRVSSTCISRLHVLVSQPGTRCTKLNVQLAPESTLVNEVAAGGVVVLLKQQSRCDPFCAVSALSFHAQNSAETLRLCVVSFRLRHGMQPNAARRDAAVSSALMAAEFGHDGFGARALSVSKTQRTSRHCFARGQTACASSFALPFSRETPMLRHVRHTWPTPTR